MFRRSERACQSVRHVQIRLDGVTVAVPDTLSVAAAVLKVHGWQGYRRHHDGSSRAPLCLMGVCQDCLITIDGKPNRQGCLVSVNEGMNIERQGGENHG
jgi:D-hydroxyproline dehydrogenase subunit gamma